MPEGRMGASPPRRDQDRRDKRNGRNGIFPHPALRATFSRQREERCLATRELSVAPHLSVALNLSVALQPTTNRSLPPPAGEGARRADGA
ncbi:hypothetical protein XAP412_250078 [Xanthomonas phaseoli pv. phaseoli]|uniref:Uncharacterized protein n=1 Tax=Xanthomonas campestris pv. phaseoli TaxID=317013 RepID=A0AB38E0D5_XANCH|nr:hypothetical protein XAP6984_310163 [Xanthomonas phaseoli pv. phaseoli]SON82446.1 hypothetical protein XAP412_250078 [Xanthomonas phaseoli pv. phaseoli]SON86571.1 hypothetical protein XAP7430_260161 [Xanthomonas phaseoli pv. phaseoli]